MCIRPFGAPCWHLKAKLTAKRKKKKKKTNKQTAQQREGLGVGCGVSGFWPPYRPPFFMRRNVQRFTQVPWEGRTLKMCGEVWGFSVECLCCIPHRDGPFFAPFLTTPPALLAYAPNECLVGCLIVVLVSSPSHTRVPHYLYHIGTLGRFYFIYLFIYY